jgi:hypothetical protein
MAMPETLRLTRCSNWPELGSVEPEAIPESTMKLGIHLHLMGLSLSDTVSVLADLGVD